MKYKKVAFHNLGCKVNAYELEAVQQLLEAAGYETVDFERSDADIYVINTCTVTNIADRKSRQMLHRAKKQNPDAVVVALGCYAQAAGEELKKDAAVDLIVGNNQKQHIVGILESYFAQLQGGKNGGTTDPLPGGKAFLLDISHTSEYESLAISRTAEHTRAFLKVQDGCNQFCSYCIIPFARGRVRSRQIGDVLEETRALAAAGYQEVVLTGIHLSSYGTDLDERPTLLELIRAVHQVEGIRRIRLGSLEPRIITEEFAGALRGMEKLCPHFHLSLQSGCDATLKRMNRRYTAEEYYEKCLILRETFDDPALTTDVIVGFPGETEEEFAQTKAFLERVRFYETHIFKYSRRQGTRAAAMEGQIPEEVKTARSHILQELNKRNMAAYEAQFRGKHAEVLFETMAEINGQLCYTGHTREYIAVNVPAGEEDLRNKICDCIL